MMSERPILFSTPMVQALLDGRKTQTRRIVKLPDYFACLTDDCPHEDRGLCAAEMPVHCPCGIPGDRLWVRETFFYRSNRTAIVYKADFPTVEAAGTGALHGGWKPSIYMPRWASRITLEITEIRVQQVQEISEEDAKAEGCEADDMTPQTWWQGYDGRPDSTDRNGNLSHTQVAQRKLPPDWLIEPKRMTITFTGWMTARRRFEMIWDSINGAGSWAANPWVWCVSFKRVEGGH